MLTVTVEAERVRIGERFAVSFQRTLRIPDDGKVYPLPPGLGAFPLRRVEDFAERLPAAWREQGGVFLPMYQREALWLWFDAAAWKPNAVKVGVGRVNAVSGGAWEEGLRADPQNYVVCPDQPWLDGINAGDGTIRQFVAMPLGLGYTVEAALTGGEEFGGIQIEVYEPRPGRFPDRPPGRAEDHGPFFLEGVTAGPAMGLGAGGAMAQRIYPDPHGIETWDTANRGGITVHIVNSEQYRSITGAEPLLTPISARTYTELGLPWFDLYDEALGHIPPAERLAGAKTIAERDAERGLPPAGDVETVEVKEDQIRKLRRTSKSRRDR
jgi:hypothetical protein